VEDPQFGDLLRSHRVAAGLTQEALAERAGLSLRGVSDLERGLRMAPHRDTLQRLLDALRLDMRDREVLQHAARRRRGATSAPRSREGTASMALPVPLSSFLGRAREMAEVQRRLAGTRLLTLTGPGGAGKTRLALQVGMEVANTFADGVAFVPLTAISDPELVASTIAQALGIRDLGGGSMLHRLTAYLQPKSFLLVLDNFEQVLPAAPLVSGILGVAPRVKVLVTSREPLRVQGEHAYEVPPLALPAPRQRLPVEAVSQYGAVALFIDRASEINAEFRLTEHNAAAVVEVCRRLDGLPLAIELAAAWIRVLPPHELMDRLEHRLALLTDGARDLPARQQTLRATIDWSHALLNSAEQALFRRVSIFVGGCTLDAAQAVAASDDLGVDVLVGVKSLVSKSLVRQREDAGGQARLGMLETIREYGLEQLQASGELALARRRHASFYLSLTEAAEPKLLNWEQVHWVRRLEVEYDNLRAVMAWSRDGSIDDELGLRLAGALAWFWVLSGVAWEARGWVDAMLTVPSAASPTHTRARALHAGARVAIVQGDPAAARAFARESVGIFHVLGDQTGAGRALSAQGAAECIDGEYQAARQSLERSIALAQEVGDRPGLAFALGQLGNVMEHDGDFAAARTFREEAAALARAVGDRHSLGIALAGLAHLARQRGDLAEATAHFHECLRLGTELGPSWRVLPRALGGLAGLACLTGDYLGSARLFGAAESLWDASGKRDMPWWRAVFDADTLAARRALGDDAFSKALAEGRAMRLDQVLASTLDDYE
jgi:predicted ATPase/transcriptional regulator with XRE-family HTH domain